MNLAVAIGHVLRRRSAFPILLLGGLLAGPVAHADSPVVTQYSGSKCFCRTDNHWLGQCGTSMVNLDKVIRTVQVVLLAVSFMSWGNRMIVFGQFMREGTTKADVTHQIELNQHGSVVYITVHQSNVLTLWAVIAASSFVVAVLLGLYRRKRYPDSKGR
jgi:hypothetical protein